MKRKKFAATVCGFLSLVIVVFTLRGSAEMNDGKASPTEISQLFQKHGFKQGLVRPPKGYLKFDYIVPQTKGVYYQLFDWDIYFVGISMAYDGIGKPLADSVKNFLEYADVNSNADGYIPREIAPEGFWALPEMVKPFLAQEAVLASQVMGTYDWIKPYYERLQHTLAYWENARRASDGLFLWYNGEESGADNNPAVTDIPAMVSEGVDLQVYIYREYLSLAVIANKIGKRKDENIYRQKAQALANLVSKEMWSEKDGMFLNIDSRTHQKVAIKTWTNFSPLWVGMANPTQAKTMIENHLLNPKEFWATHGVRTISRDEKKYAPKDGYWRGPVWIVSNYLMMHGLMNYGYTRQAQELAQKTVNLVVADIRQTKGMNECYNPETGEPTAEGNFLDWDLLAEHMQEEAATGANPMALP